MSKIIAAAFTIQFVCETFVLMFLLSTYRVKWILFYVFTIVNILIAGLVVTYLKRAIDAHMTGLTFLCVASLILLLASFFVRLSIYTDKHKDKK